MAAAGPDHARRSAAFVLCGQHKAAHALPLMAKQVFNHASAVSKCQALAVLSFPYKRIHDGEPQVGFLKALPLRKPTPRGVGSKKFIRKCCGKQDCSLNFHH